MEKVRPDDTVNMDIKYKDLYLVYALLGYCNDTQFVGDYCPLLWDQIYNMGGDRKAKVHQEFFSSRQGIQETIKFLNTPTTSTHMESFDRLFNSDYSIALEGINEELEELDRKVKLAEIRKSKLLNQS
jgi:hypothetical protein